ncbi:hypothetical protein [Antarcticimicrobium luteum]|uniref:hypothetical protein n=1 Tax=Antarcticimicrobium luteum TaxID=2547397 RepID=UPI00197CEE2E|nr:hypothetical protein [Antarcticimicrobium luteum]
MNLLMQESLFSENFIELSEFYRDWMLPPDKVCWCATELSPPVEAIGRASCRHLAPEGPPEGVQQGSQPVHRRVTAVDASVIERVEGSADLGLDGTVDVPEDAPSGLRYQVVPNLRGQVRGQCDLRTDARLHPIDLIEVGRPYRIPWKRRGHGQRGDGPEPGVQPCGTRRRRPWAGV